MKSDVEAVDFEEVDVVVPLADVPGTPIKAGTQGTVLVKGQGAAPELLVEFTDSFGVTVAEVWLKPIDVRLVWSARTGRFVNDAATLAAAA